MRPTLPRGRAGAAAVLLGLLLLTAADRSAAQPPPPGKKVLTPADYDAWKAASGVTLSRDGKYVAYTVAPTDGPGDGEVVVRHLPTGKDVRVARGGRPEPPPPTGPTPPGIIPPGTTPPTPPRPTAVGLAGGPQFSPDSTKVVFPLTPTKAELDAAKTAKAKLDEPPQPVLAVMELPAGTITARIERVKGFTVGGTGAGVLLYQRQTKAEAKADTPAPKSEAGAPAGKGGRPGGFAKKGGGGGAATPETAPAPRAVRTYGSELVVRNLATGAEHTIPDVGDYQLTKDGKLLVYTVSARDDSKNGVYVADPTSLSPGVAIANGGGRYARLVWDEKQTKLAFFHDTAGVVTDPKVAPMPRPAGVPLGAEPREPLPPPVWHVYVWDRKAEPVAAGPGAGRTAVLGVVATGKEVTATPAAKVFGPETPGQKKEWVPNGSTLSFSADGSRLFLATGLPPKEPAPPAATPAVPAADKVELDLWHWKDGYVQPMQKLRGDAERNRTHTAVVFLDTKEFRQLGEVALQVGPPAAGDWAVGSNDKPYLQLTGYGPTLRDYAIVNIKTGEKKSVATASEAGVTPSLDGKHLLTFDGKDWFSVSVPEGKRTNLTAKLPAKFFNEEDDHPGPPPPYGVAGWTPDAKLVLVNDRYDVWKLAADGSSAENLTKTGRPQQVRFRVLRVPAEGDEADDRKGFDLSKPLLLSAENLHTRDSGFYRLEPGGPPKMLVMGPRKYGTPTKAKTADVYLLTVQSFYDFPDYYSTGPDFHELKRVTDINPHAREYNWGRSELVQFKSLDGTPLSGVLVKPEDFDPQKKYPLVVYIYERLSDTVHQFRPPNVTRGQVINPTFYASNGYLVLMPDIAYKVGAPGPSAIKCVLPAVQAVVDKGYVDEAAIGINGQSWGGYQIAYMVTQTNRFKAASAGAAVSNMVSAYGGIRWGTGLPRQFQYERQQSRIGETLWKAPMRYIENSPVFMADRVETPLLLIHNDQDDAVPWQQGIEFFLALRRLGKECYLLNYNGEPHNLARKANARDFAGRMFQFFEHHLRGKPAPEWMVNGVPYTDRDKVNEKAPAPAEKK